MNCVEIGESRQHYSSLSSSRPAAKMHGASALKGMKIRQEFLCPITHDLIRDPVVLADGFTYERSAIERWIKTIPPDSRCILSPMSGEMIQSTVLSNLTLKKLIQDLINEGGAGLYTVDTSNGDRMFEVRKEKILCFTCLGPPGILLEPDCLTTIHSSIHH